MKTALTLPRVCIIGTGYVGMASAIGLAELGARVVGYDILKERVAALRAGITPYREAGIEEHLRRHIDSERLSFESDFAAAVRDAELLMIAVGTPSAPDGGADLSAVRAVVAALKETPLAPGAVVVVRSTVPTGTSDAIAAELDGIADVIYAPEFLREGTAVGDFLNPDRIVIGCSSIPAGVKYARMFEALEAPVMLTSRRNAELIKGVSNAFLAMKISFANEIANLCDAMNADSEDVLRGVGYDRRIGEAFLQPGIGFGGPCFEKDVKSLRHLSSEVHVACRLAQATLAVNEFQPRRIAAIVEEALGDVRGLTLGVWGLAFKAGTDDTRDSLAMRIVADLAERGARIVAYDPAVAHVDLPDGCTLARSVEEPLDTDALVILTEWPLFRTINPHEMATRLRRNTVIDGRNLLDAERMLAAGVRYRSIGRAEPVRTAEPAAVFA